MVADRVGKDIDYDVIYQVSLWALGSVMGRKEMGEKEKKQGEQREHGDGAVLLCCLGYYIDKE